jgi:ABC-type glycerol-3-phosphate transport system substrate-binding protein
MYWNRDLFSGAGFPNPPQFWNDLLLLAPKVSTLGSASQVKKSAVALGQWANINSAKEILSTLFIQAGDPITARNTDGTLIAVLGNNEENTTPDAAASALRFYTEFANPSKSNYSWNRSLPKSGDMFASGDLAVYFGFASEYPGFALRNPNLHYSVAVMPQIEGSNTKAAYGRLTGLAIPRTSLSPSGALAVAEKLSGPVAQSLLPGLTGLPLVRRDITLDTSQNAAMETFVQSSLIAKAWLDPSPKDTDLMFQSMIESVVSGKAEPAQAVFDASRELQTLVGN